MKIVRKKSVKIYLITKCTTIDYFFYPVFRDPFNFHQKSREEGNSRQNLNEKIETLPSSSHAILPSTRFLLLNLNSNK